MHRQVTSLSILIITLLLTFTVTSATALSIVTTPEMAIQAEEWHTYTDPRFDFTVEYPANWIVLPRNDSYGVGATLTFTSDLHGTGEGADPHDAPPKVEIGMYLVTWSEREQLPNRSLRGWTRRYNELSEGSGTKSRIRQSRTLQVDRQEALYEEGTRVLNFRYVNVPRGDIVWFIWSNIEEAADILLFEKMVASFRFGKNTPNTLQEVYGDDFQSFPLQVQPEANSHMGSSIQQTKLDEQFIFPLALSSSWRSPLQGGPHNGGCNSAFHNGSSDFAIDLPRPAGTLVVGSNTGNITFAGWDNNYGNLVRAMTGTQQAFYAHLQSIDWDTLYFTAPFQTVKRSLSVGWVGNTGNSTNNHLHFHVQNGVAPITLVGMQTFNAVAGLYPQTGDPCATVRFP